jgi:hypothetical protein
MLIRACVAICYIVMFPLRLITLLRPDFKLGSIGSRLDLAAHIEK